MLLIRSFQATDSSAEGRDKQTSVGCGQPVKTPTTQKAGAGKANHDQVADQIRQDPVGYLESCLDRCKQLDAFTTTFYRQERLGIVPTLRPVERILAKWRRSPLRRVSS